MVKILSFLKDYKKETMLAPAFKMLEAALELIVPLIMAAIIDTGIVQQNYQYVAIMCLSLVGLGVVGLCFSITAQYFAAKAAVGLTKALRQAVFVHIQQLSFTELDTVGAPTLITRMTSDMNQVQNGVNLTLRLLLRSPFVVFGAMIMAFTIDVKVALIFVVVIPVLSIIVFGIMLWCIPGYRRVQTQLDRVLAVTRSNLDGVRVIRAFCNESEESERFRENNHTLTTLQKQVGRVSALMNPLTYCVINGGILVLIGVGAMRVDAGILTQGAVVALYNYMAQILVELIKLANLILTMTKSVASGNRIQAVLDVQPSQKDGEITESRYENANRIELNHVSLRYNGANADALSDITFTATPGETVGIIGGTGSGKSSLVGLLPRFYDATEGTVCVDGVDVCAYHRDYLRQKIGIVPQQAVLFAGTIRENLCWGKPDATDAELWSALGIAQAQKVVKDKPEGLDTQVEQGGRNFSGGQRQRLTIARAVVRQPEILILDDSASALDFATDAALRQAIKTLPGAPTILIVSQRVSAIRQADTIIVLDDGKMAGMGTHEELMENSTVYREIVASQEKGNGGNHESK